MYMIAFVTLVVALIGAYAQAWTVQARNLYQKQTAISDAMVTWHQTAVSMASLFVTPNSATATGCSLTYMGTTSGLCAGNGVSSTYISKTVVNSATQCDPAHTNKCMTLLPSEFQTNPYTFYSTVFKTTGANARTYVVTYVPKPTTLQVGVDLLCLPGGSTCTNRLPISFSGFATQMAKNPKISSYSYGTVLDTGCGTGVYKCLVTSAIPLVTSLDTGATPEAKTLVYPLPVSIPTNAIGIITEALPCTSCISP